MTTTDRWLIVKVDDGYKIFGSWSGGYLYGGSWKLNSGITKVEEDGDYYLFCGYSGSIYKCHKDAYGSTGYGWSIISSYVDEFKDRMAIIEEPECFEIIKGEPWTTTQS